MRRDAAKGGVIMSPHRLYVSPVRMQGHALPEYVLEWEFRKRTYKAHQDVLVPRRVSGHEGIGQLFEYRIEAVYSVVDPAYFGRYDRDIDLDAIKGSHITLTFKDAYRNDIHRSKTERERTGEREISGMVESAGILGTEGGALVYEFVIRPSWWRATLCRNSRIFTDSDITRILQTVLTPYSHEIEFRVKFDTRFNHEASQRDFIRQAWETDWDFCMRLCEEFGYVIWFEHHDRKHVLVIADCIRACQEQSAPYDTLSYHPDGGHIDREHITHLSWRTSVALDRVVVNDHSYMSPRLRRNSEPYRGQYGPARREHDESLESYESAEYAQPDTTRYSRRDDDAWKKDAQHLARVKLEARRGQRLRAQGRGALRGIEAGKTFTLIDHPHGEANNDYLVLSCTLDIRAMPGMSGRSTGYSFETTFELYPAREPYRMPQVTPRPRLEDLEYAVIVGPNDAEILIDAYNRVLIQYAWDCEGEFNGGTSIWVRVAQPWQGDQMGTVMHGRCGQQVLVGYVNGDPDRPVVVAFVPDVNNMPAWKLPDNHALSGMVTRSLGHGSTTNHLAFDDTENRQQLQIASDHGKSSLSLGYNTRIDGNQGRQDPRGEGFELRTDRWGALRAALGLLLTTFGRDNATGKVKDMGETVARLTQARQQHEDLSQIATRHQAQTSDSSQSDATSTIKAQNDAIKGGTQTGDGEFPELSRPDMVMASAAGIATTASDSTHMASHYDHAITAGRDVSVSSGRSFFASVRGAISMFAYQLGLKLIAAKGKVVIQAQSDQMELDALKDLLVRSTDGKIIINAAKEVWIGAGGSYIQINGSGITNGSPGPILEKTPKWSKPEADAQVRSFQPFGSGTPDDGYLHSL
ncbi:type VI secretion system Vgr family protein [Paraburkholderia dokdonensis]|nr:type VI secretion system Vgr family protein [Paraburkholderia dokdonensis]